MSLCITQFLASFYTHSSIYLLLLQLPGLAAGDWPAAEPEHGSRHPLPLKKQYFFETTTAMSYERIMSLNKLILLTIVPSHGLTQQRSTEKVASSDPFSRVTATFWQHPLSYNITFPLLLLVSFDDFSGCAATRTADSTVHASLSRRSGRLVCSIEPWFYWDERVRCNL